MEVRIAARSPWVASLEPQDLRFPSQNTQPVDQWMLDAVETEGISPATVFFCDQLVAADKCDWRTELEAVARAALKISERRPGSERAKDRWVAIFLRRFSGPTGLTLQAVGDEAGLTRERVRQICDAVIQILETRPTAMPALDKLMAAAARIAPVHFEETDVQLAKLLGPGIGLVAALEFAQLIGWQTVARTAFAERLRAMKQCGCSKVIPASCSGFKRPSLSPKRNVGRTTPCWRLAGPAIKGSPADE